ncbi:S66 peptidase family protein [Rhizobium grahamii]|uniref:MccF-like protein n=1 Tax=Rhizobium grahamii CCGE 502 TaxID=990285 RepID=S3I409_9HYPH|nr:LD-carboxypeptidase [Rhizobium grahamii]EPE94378.1 MccF-like protein [Rhizobium grahamii CCGE 502]
MTNPPPRLLAHAIGPHPRIAIIAPSWGGIGSLPSRAARALAALSTLGAEPVLMPHAASAADVARPWVSAGARERAADLHAAFADPSIDAVLCAIGGDHSAQLLPSIDMGVIAASPKPLCGYSDATVLLHAIHHETGLVCFYGPSLLPQFGEIDGLDAEVIEHLCRTIVHGDTAPGNIPDIGWQADEPRELSDREHRPRRRRAAEPRRALRVGHAIGRLMPACLPSLQHLIGTPWQPRLAGTLLALDVPGEGYDIRRADADLTHLANAGVLTEIASLVLGRSDGWSATDVDRFDKIAIELTAPTKIPVLAGIACSHASPMLTLPIGALAELDGLHLRILEPVVAGRPDDRHGDRG